MLCGVGENGQIAKTIWKINLKQKYKVAVRRVNTCKQNLYKSNSWWRNQYSKISTYISCAKRGRPKGCPLTV
ncbi:MAG: hypothetical protein WCK78_15815 [Paludibacter sp.]